MGSMLGTVLEGIPTDQPRRDPMHPTLDRANPMDPRLFMDPPLLFTEIPPANPLPYPTDPAPGPV